jgi:hypothetical protein
MKGTQRAEYTVLTKERASFIQLLSKKRAQAQAEPPVDFEELKSPPKKEPILAGKATASDSVYKTKPVRKKVTAPVKMNNRRHEHGDAVPRDSEQVVPSRKAVFRLVDDPILNRRRKNIYELAKMGEELRDIMDIDRLAVHEQTRENLMRRFRNTEIADTVADAVQRAVNMDELRDVIWASEIHPSSDLL